MVKLFEAAQGPNSEVRFRARPEGNFLRADKVLKQRVLVSQKGGEVRGNVHRKK